VPKFPARSVTDIRRAAPSLVLKVSLVSRNCGILSIPLRKLRNHSRNPPPLQTPAPPPSIQRFKKVQMIAETPRVSESCPFFPFAFFLLRLLQGTSPTLGFSCKKHENNAEIPALSVPDIRRPHGPSSLRSLWSPATAGSSRSPPQTPNHSRNSSHLPISPIHRRCPRTLHRAPPSVICSRNCGIIRHSSFGFLSSSQRNPVPPGYRI